MPKRKWGDRRDARWVKETPPLQVVMASLMPNRTDNEGYLHDELDITNLVEYLKAKNEQHPDYKTTPFHALVYATSKMVKERPRMNNFIQGRRMYERYEISASFVARRKFVDHSEESLMFFTAKDEDNLDSLSYRIAGKVYQERQSEHAIGGVDKVLETIAHMPRLLVMLITKIARILDFWGVCPKFLTDGDPNFSSVFLVNLGSVGCPAVYHHLNNYGSNSCMITMGIIHDVKKVMEDGSEQIRKIVDIGCTVDERIADGFYFARSLKLVKHMMLHPELFDQTMGEPIEFDYNARVVN